METPKGKTKTALFYRIDMSGIDSAIQSKKEMGCSVSLFSVNSDQRHCNRGRRKMFSYVLSMFSYVFSMYFSQQSTYKTIHRHLKGRKHYPLNYMKWDLHMTWD
jgi:hypothetical protein